MGCHPEKLGGLSRHPSPPFAESAPSLFTAYPPCMCCLLVSDDPGYQTDRQGITVLLVTTQVIRQTVRASQRLYSANPCLIIVPK